MVPYHSQLRVLEHSKYKFILLIVVHDVPKGMRIRVIASPMLQRSLLLRGFQHGTKGCRALTSRDAESFGSGTAWQRVFRKCLYRTRV